MPKEKKCSIGKQNEALKAKLKPLEGHHNYGEKPDIVKTQFFLVKNITITTKVNTLAE